MTLIRFQRKTYDPSIMVRYHSTVFRDPNCIRETPDTDHRYRLVSKGRVNCTPDVTCFGQPIDNRRVHFVTLSPLLLDRLYRIVPLNNGSTVPGIQ